MASPSSATAQALALPELLPEVFAHLGQADLARTALVCRDWAACTRVVLYRAPALVSPDGADSSAPSLPFQRLIRTISAEPALAERVRSLDLVCRFPHLVAPAVARLLVRCSRVVRLELWGWNLIANMDRLIAAAAAYAPQLRHLSVPADHLFAALAPYLASFVNLTNLKFMDSQFSSTDRDGVDVLSWPAPAFQLTHLGALFDARSPPGLAAFDWLTRSSRASLRHLTFDRCGAAVVASLLEWGAQLRTLHVMLQLPESGGQLGEAAAEQALGAAKLAELEGLDEFLVTPFASREDEPAFRALLDQIDQELGRINQRRGKSVARLESF